MIEIKQALPTYGERLLETLDDQYFKRCAVFCAPEAWEFLQQDFPVVPEAVVVPESMEQDVITERINSMPKASTIFGIGGGSACDAAKMAAWMTGAKLVLMPSVMSVDAAFTSAVGIRFEHHVRYIGDIYPEHLLIDFDLLKHSPRRLNLAGIGDILSIFTALYDWKLAADTVGESYNEEIANDSRVLLNTLLVHSDAIKACENEGLNLISELYVAEVALCERHGDSRPEEGSEHYFAYCLESITHKPYIHGELIALAILLTALYQGQDVAEIARFLKTTGVAYAPEQIGVTEKEIRNTLLMLPEFLESETQLPYGIYHHKGMDIDRADDLINKLKKLKR